MKSSPAGRADRRWLFPTASPAHRKRYKGARLTTGRRLALEPLESRCLLSSVSGTEFNDLNGDALRDAGEPGLAGWTIHLSPTAPSTSGGEWLRTFANPTPGWDAFGASLASSGNDFIVGAYIDSTDAHWAGIAYVFDALGSGSPKLVLHNPSPGNDERFGFAVAATGTNWLVGAYGHNGGVGEAYLFDGTTGALLRTIANPYPNGGDGFGISVAAGGGKILVGAQGDDTGGSDAGAAYLFDAATGQLLQTFVGHAAGDNFGGSVAVLGDRLIIGAAGEDAGATDAGAIYVFDSTSGAQLLKIANPTPAPGEWFGYPMRAMDGRILVGSAGATGTGAVYVFDAITGGLTMTIPAPQPGTAFGGSSMAVAGNTIVVGAIYETEAGAAYAGAAYVFDSTTGALLKRLTAPSPHERCMFGSVAALGDKILVAGGDDLWGPGHVELYSGFSAASEMTAVTGADGSYRFAGVPAGQYRVWEESQPGYVQTFPAGDGSHMITVQPGQDISSLNFGNVLVRRDLSGTVFNDLDNDGVHDDGEAGIDNVVVTLQRQDTAEVWTTTTSGGGQFLFADLLSGTYTLIETQPSGYLDGDDTAGTWGGTVENAEDRIRDIVFNIGDPDATGYLFGEIRPSRIQGLVWEDFNDDGEVNFGEKAIEGVEIGLIGSDDRGHELVDAVMATDGQGIFEFIDLRPGNYTLVETQPAGYADGKDSLGTVNGTPGGSVVNDGFSDIVLSRPGSEAVNFNFGERPLAGGQVRPGQTATIGFWQNKNGQALIRALTSGDHSVNDSATSTQLGDWLAATFPNMYGSTEPGGVNLAGMTNAGVAALYTSLFKRTAKTSIAGPPKLDAQVMAVALAVYVTNQTLAGNTAGGYGFSVTQSGVGYATFDVGSANRAAFGLSAGESTVLTVLDILKRTDAKTRKGVLYDEDGNGQIDALERALRVMANDVYSAINEQGGI